MNGPAPEPSRGSSRGRQCIILSGLVAVTLPPARLRAQAEPVRQSRRVLLLADPASDPFMSRIRAEIASLGLEVVVRAPKASIEASARAEHAVAAIRMLPSRKGIEVWMADATSGRSLLRQTIVDEAPGGPNQNVIALQTAELLRTSLFPRRPAEPSRPVAPAPVRVIIQAPPPPAGDSHLRGGLGILYGAGGAAPAWQATLSYQYIWNRGLGAAFSVSAPLRRGALNGPEGSAEVGSLVVGPELLARLPFLEGRLALTTGLGVGLVAVFTRGHPNQEAGSQLVSNASVAYTGAGYACVALALRISSWLGLGVSGLAGATPARVHIRFAGNDAGDWGTLVLGAGLFGEVGWR